MDNTITVPIDSIQFSILGNAEIKKMSVIESRGIFKPETYNNYDPVIGGLNDQRLGTSDLHLKCSSCGLNSLKCIGHFGHIDLAVY